VADFGQDWVRRRILADRKLPSVVLGSRTGAYALEFHAEQSPTPDSTIRLTDSRDSLGVPRLRVDWRMAPGDAESLERAYRLLDEPCATRAWAASTMRRASLPSGRARPGPMAGIIWAARA
jgi:hypothetical protein